MSEVKRNSFLVLAFVVLSAGMADAQQMEVDGAMDHCIRVLLLVDTDLKQSEIQHVYMGRALELRPDLRNFG